MREPVVVTAHRQTEGAGNWRLHVVHLREDVVHLKFLYNGNNSTATWQALHNQDGFALASGACTIHVAVRCRWLLAVAACRRYAARTVALLCKSAQRISARGLWTT